ncbi:MAG: DUF1592 domain-containing protein [Planctomycetales bacterium]|nr:DUF1592 domain-containing protein [Planctomycetales bacterium]
MKPTTDFIQRGMTQPHFLTRVVFLTSWVWLFVESAICAQPTQDTFEPQVFFTAHCVQCHGSEVEKGDRRFDPFPIPLETPDQAVDYQDVLDQLILGEMPPPEESQPTAEERQLAVDWLNTQLHAFRESHRPVSREVVLRRLNSREYRNTIRDLLHLNTVIFDPAFGFPLDQLSDGLDNNGNSLVTSGYLLQKYLAAAEKCIDKAAFPRVKPDEQTWHFADGFRQQPEIDQVHGKTNHFQHITLYEVIGADKHEGAYAPIWQFRDGVPSDGWYEIRFQAEALNRLHPYDDSFLGIDSSEPLRLGIRPGDVTAGQLHKPQPVEPLLAETDIADELGWYTLRVWLDAGYTPRFTYQNGTIEMRNLYARIIRKYPDLFPKLKTGGIVEARFTALNDGKIPQIRIHQVEIHGPQYESWPTESQRAIFGPDVERILSAGEFPESQMRQQLDRFMARAYRRPATKQDVDRVMSVIQLRIESGRPLLDAYCDGLKTILCSPAFLYLSDSADSAASNMLLSDFELATRLSYFLWGSLPDDQLTELAQTGQLSQHEILMQQVDRMLLDSRVTGFLDGFLSSWLRLRDLGASPPDRDAFLDYYQYDLGTAMRKETELFTRHLINENLSIRNFLDSDFTFVNKALAKHYGLPAPSTSGFEKVSVQDRRRGGLLGQASVLTVTANGIDTSPVVRGIWVLENILGIPAPPPPADVPPLDPDIRGATSIRDQLEKHRSVSTCYDCHRKIDPLGFALEHYDPVGAWREKYNSGTEIDSSGQLPSGEGFSGVEEFKSLMTAHEEQFARGLTTKLLSYATGRQLEAAERVVIDKIVDSNRQAGSGFRDLIKACVSSEIFLQP